MKYYIEKSLKGHDTFFFQFLNVLINIFVVLFLIIKVTHTQYYKNRTIQQRATRRWKPHEIIDRWFEEKQKRLPEEIIINLSLVFWNHYYLYLLKEIALGSAMCPINFLWLLGGFYSMTNGWHLIRTPNVGSFKWCCFPTVATGNVSKKRPRTL